MLKNISTLALLLFSGLIFQQTNAQTDQRIYEIIEKVYQPIVLKPIYANLQVLAPGIPLATQYLIPEELAQPEDG